VANELKLKIHNNYGDLKFVTAFCRIMCIYGALRLHTFAGTLQLFAGTRTG